MKNIFIKAFTIILCLSLVLTTFSVSADKPLYEKYKYNENFEYNDVMIGHALKATVPKILHDYSARVRYQPMKLDVDSLAEQVNVWTKQLTEAGYSEDEISARLVQEIERVLPRYTTYGPYREESAHFAGHGSGVVLSEDGYIATNAHVVELDDQTKLMLYMSSLSSSVAGDLRVMLQDAERYGVTFSDADVDFLYEQLLYKSCENAQISDEVTTLTACFASPDGDTSIDKANKYEAEVKKIGTQDGVEGLTQDTAIIKINAKNLVALPLSDTYPEYNSKIVSAGYPGIAEFLFEMAGSEASSLSVSIGTGQVARIVPIEGTNYKALEITTTISNGNSGGPSVDQQLHIEGLNTYGPTEDKRFAYMISAEFIRNLTHDLNIGIGETSKTFFTGLQMLQQNYGPAAEECFKKVKNMQANTAFIDHTIKAATDAPDNKFPVEDEKKTNGSFFDMIFSNTRNTILFISACVLLLLIIIIIIVLICSGGKKRRRKKNAAEAVEFSRSYIPSTMMNPSSTPMTADTIPNINHNGNSIQPQPYGQATPPDTMTNTLHNQNSFSPDSTAYFATPEVQDSTAYFATPEVQASQPIAPQPVTPQPEVPAKPRLKSTMKKSTDDNI